MTKEPLVNVNVLISILHKYESWPLIIKIEKESSKIIPFQTFSVPDIKTDGLLKVTASTHAPTPEIFLILISLRG
jgi:hypothetical protein